MDSNRNHSIFPRRHNRNLENNSDHKFILNNFIIRALSSIMRIGISFPAYRLYFIIPRTRMKGRSTTDRNVYSKGWWVRAGYNSSRADGIYFLGKQMNTKTNFRWSSSALIRPRFSIFRVPSRRRRDVIVKYDYSVSRILFLTPGSSPSFSLVLATVQWSTNDRSAQYRVRQANTIQSYRLSSNDIARNPASWLKYPARVVFPRWDFR